MRSLSILFALILAALMPLSAGQLSVRELKDLVDSARTAGASDADIARKVSRVEMKERLSDEVLAEIRAGGLGPNTTRVLELLADESEFAPGVGVRDAARPTLGQEAAILASARAFAANYVRNLPDFICTRLILRFDNRSMRSATTGPTLDGLHLLDSIASEVSFDQGKESYSAQTVNGKVHDQPVMGLTTWGEFGGIIEDLLAGGSNPKTEWSRWEIIDGQRVAVFRYTVDRQHSRYTVTWCCNLYGSLRMRPEYRGELFIAPASGSVVRLTRRAVLLPGSATRSADTVVEYRPVNIGGNPYICPVKSVTMSIWKLGVFRPPVFAGPTEFSHWMHSLSEVRFGSYHKFGASSTLLASDAQPGVRPELAAPPAPDVAVATDAVPCEGPAPLNSQPAIGRDNPDVPSRRPLPPRGTILRSMTRLVDISAVVLDKHGNSVINLKKEDFEIYDDGKRQNIRLFSAPVASVPDSTEALTAASGTISASPRVFANRAEESSRPDGVTIFSSTLGLRQRRSGSMRDGGSSGSFSRPSRGNESDCIHQLETGLELCTNSRESSRIS